MENLGEIGTSQVLLKNFLGRVCHFKEMLDGQQLNHVLIIGELRQGTEKRFLPVFIEEDNIYMLISGLSLLSAIKRRTTPGCDRWTVESRQRTPEEVEDLQLTTSDSMLIAGISLPKTFKQLQNLLYFYAATPTMVNETFKVASRTNLAFFLSTFSVSKKFRDFYSDIQDLARGCELVEEIAGQSTVLTKNDLEFLSHLLTLCISKSYHSNMKLFIDNRKKAWEFGTKKKVTLTDLNIAEPWFKEFQNQINLVSSVKMILIEYMLTHPESNFSKLTLALLEYNQMSVYKMIKEFIQAGAKCHAHIHPSVMKEVIDFDDLEIKLTQLYGNHLPYYRFYYTGDLTFSQRKFKSLAFVAYKWLSANVISYQQYKFAEKYRPANYEYLEALTRRQLGGNFDIATGLNEAQVERSLRIFNIDRPTYNAGLTAEPISV